MDIEKLFEGFDSQTQLDFKLNFKKFFLDGKIPPMENGMVLLASAETVNCAPLIEFAEAHIRANGGGAAEIGEARDMAAVMGIANNYYRFRHFVEKEAYQKPAGFRISVMAKPVTNKLNQEMMALAASIINGCETCVQGHEKSVLDHGGTEEQIHDLARLASTVNGLAVLFRQRDRQSH